MSQGETQSAKNLPLAILLGIIAAIYIGLLLLSPSNWLPGDPAWAIQPQTIHELIDESLNFFFVLPILNVLGFTGMTAPNVHPVSQAFFNLAEAWIFMFLPLLGFDPRGKQLPTPWIWLLAMFLTNVFLLPYMAIRLLQEPKTEEVEKKFIAKSFGIVGLMIGVVSLLWAIFWQPEIGGFVERGHFFIDQLFSNRVMFAFGIDIVLFYCFQIWLMGAIIPKESQQRNLRFFPLFGLGLWLIL